MQQGKHRGALIVGAVCSVWVLLLAIDRIRMLNYQSWIGEFDGWQSVAWHLSYVVNIGVPVVIMVLAFVGVRRASVVPRRIAAGLLVTTIFGDLVPIGWQVARRLNIASQLDAVLTILDIVPGGAGWPPYRLLFLTQEPGTNNLQNRFSGVLLPELVIVAVGIASILVTIVLIALLLRRPAGSRTLDRQRLAGGGPYAAPGASSPPQIQMNRPGQQPTRGFPPPTAPAWPNRPDGGYGPPPSYPKPPSSPPAGPRNAHPERSEWPRG